MAPVPMLKGDKKLLSESMVEAAKAGGGKEGTSSCYTRRPYMGLIWRFERLMSTREAG